MYLYVHVFPVNLFVVVMVKSYDVAFGWPRSGHLSGDERSAPASFWFTSSGTCYNRHLLDLAHRVLLYRLHDRPDHPHAHAHWCNDHTPDSDCHTPDSVCHALESYYCNLHFDCHIPTALLGESWTDRHSFRFVDRLYPMHNHLEQARWEVVERVLAGARTPAQAVACHKSPIAEEQADHQLSTTLTDKDPDTPV